MPMPAINPVFAFCYAQVGTVPRIPPAVMLRKWLSLCPGASRTRPGKRCKRGGATGLREFIRQISPGYWLPPRLSQRSTA